MDSMPEKKTAEMGSPSAVTTKQVLGFVVTQVAVLAILFVAKLSWTTLICVSVTLASSMYFGLRGFVRHINFNNLGKGQQLEKIERYENLYGANDRTDVSGETAVSSTTEYYDMVTDWYEACWGQSFQLGGAQGFKDESFAERLRRHDYWFANRAGVKKGQKWLDVGCGVGGPMRNIIRFTEASISGVNYNQYQLQRARRHLANEGLEQYGSFHYCDMHKLTDILPAASFDGVYALEAVCHSADKLLCYKQFYSILKPGGTYVCNEWVMTDKYDPNNPTHKYCKHAIEVFAGVTSLQEASKIVELLKEAGFEVVEVEDMSLQTRLFPDPWYSKFEPSISPRQWLLSKAGIAALQFFLRITEMVGFVPKGSAQAHRTIASGIEGTVLSGKLGIFTPHYFVRVRKPL